MSNDANRLARRALWATLRGYRRKLALGSISSIVTAFAEVSVLAAILATVKSIATGDGYPLTNPFNGSSIVLSTPQLLLICTALTLIRAASQILLAFVMARLATGYEADQRRRLVSAFLRASWDCQSRERSGHIISQLLQYVETASRAVSHFGMAISSFVYFIVLIGSALFFDWRCAIAVLVLSGLVFAVLRPLSAWARNYASRRVSVHSNFAGLVGQGFGMAKEFRVFGVSDYFGRAVGQLVGNIRRFRSAQLFLTAMIPTLYQNMSVLIVLGGLTTIYLTNYGSIMSLSLVVLLLMRSMSYGQQLQMYYHSIVEGTAYVQELQTAEADYLRHALPEDGADLARIESLAMEGVSFHYQADQTVLHEISFGVHRGEMIGIVGRSGSGKSTLMQLLLRLREPQTGRYLVNDRPIDEIAYAAWFKHIAFVPQEAVLLNESIAECIRFHRDDISDDRVREAARQAGVYDEIMAMPAGFDAPAGERGGNLSGGQRQRICIARALAGAPDVIVFDEPTSALDVHSEAVILETLTKLKGRVTTFIIAHRLSTLNMCDRVMVLRNGVIQSFDAPSVLAKNDAYYNEALKLAQVH